MSAGRLRLGSSFGRAPGILTYPAQAQRPYDPASRLPTTHQNMVCGSSYAIEMISQDVEEPGGSTTKGVSEDDMINSLG